MLRFWLTLPAHQESENWRKTPLPLRNIFDQKCHEVFSALATALVLLCCFPVIARAQFQPPLLNTPPPATGQLSSNPNRIARHAPPGAPSPNEVSVSSVVQDIEGPIRHLRGAVKLETSEMKLEADSLDYNRETGDAVATGNVRFESFIDGDKIWCDHAEYNIETETGKFYDVHGTSPAKIQSRPGLLTTSNPFYFEGKWAERLGDKYVLYDGFITDCKLPRPWWVLRGPKFDVIPGDRALAYRAFFRLRNIPLLYFPFFYKSLEREPRKSGFLTPNVGNSSIRGPMVGIGYYWAINRSYDVLYRIQDFVDRGFAHTAEIRGKVRPGTDFDANLYGVTDRGLKIGTNADGSPNIQKQGGFQATVDGRSDLGDGWFAGGELNYLSSFLFRQSFTESFHEAVFSETHSVGFLTKHWSTYGLTFDAERNQNFQSTLPNDVVSIRKLPEADFVGRDRLISDKVLPIWFSFEATSGLMDRQQPVSDQSTSLLDAPYSNSGFVSRTDLAPTVTTAFSWKGFTLTPSFSVRETEYSKTLRAGEPEGGAFLRSARELNVELMPPSLARVYQAPKWLGVKMKHVIEPRAEFRYVSGVTNFDRLLHFDESDLLADTKELEVSVANRLYARQANGSVDEVLSWQVSQVRYFEPDFGGALAPGQRNVLLNTIELTGFSFLAGPRNYSPIVSTLRVQKKIGLEWRADYDPLTGHIADSSINADARFSKYLVSFGHTEVNENTILSPPSNQLRALFAIGDNNRRGWNAGTSVYYDYNRTSLQYATAQVTYNTDCCGLSVQFRRFNFGTRQENQFRVAFALSNLATFGTLRRQDRTF